MRVLVTGGTGYLGAAIVRAVSRHGHQPVIFSRRASAAELPGVPIDGDIRDLPSLRRAAEGVEAIVHSAALVSQWHPRPVEFHEVNIGGVHNVLDVTRSLGIAKIIYTSSFMALPPYGTDAPLDANDYLRTKRDARGVMLAAADRGAPIVTLYPGVVYGPGPPTEGNLVGRLLRDHLRGRLPGIIGADRQWSFSYVDDVAEAHVAAVERAESHGEYTVGGENAPQMRVFELARELTGARLPRRIPARVAYTFGAFEAARSAMTGRPPFLTHGAVEIFLHDWRLDSTRTVRELSYRMTPLDAGIRATLAGLT
jgi:NAD+-dependent farnesol dehydrogenase